MLRLVVVFFALIYSCSSGVNQGKVVSKESLARASDNPSENYENFCAGCHGAQLKEFINKDWKYGKSWLDVRNSISKGYPNDGMSSFSGTFSEEQINNLTDYILEGVEKLELEKNQNQKEKDFSKTINSQKLDFRLELVTKVGQVPWGVAVLPGSIVLATERSGKLYTHAPNLRPYPMSLEATEIKNVPKVRAEGQGGLMDIAVDPNFNDNRTLYLSYSKPNPNNSNESTTAVARAILERNQLIDVEDIFVAKPYLPTTHHYGSRLAFDQEGYLYITVGDRGRREDNPQALDNDCGKIHRIHSDGRIPEDNPFTRDGKKLSIYSMGHRNPQGLIWDNQSKQMLEHEHGPRGGDELNLIRPKKNYGWPLVSYGINYDGTTFTDKVKDESFTPPLHYWVPSIAPSGLALVDADKYANWNGDLLIGSLRFQYLHRIDIENYQVVNEEKLLPGIGRLRNVVMGQDGFLYIAVENPGRIYRIIPQNN